MRKILPFLIFIFIFQTFIAPIFGGYSLLLLLLVIFVLPAILSSRQVSTKSPSPNQPSNSENSKQSDTQLDPLEQWDPEIINQTVEVKPMDKPTPFDTNQVFKTQVKTTKAIPVILPPKQQREDDALMFLSENEEVILSATGSRNRPIAVYDRSKHLIGYLAPAIGLNLLKYLDAGKISYAQIDSISQRFNTPSIKIKVEIKA